MNDEIKLLLEFIISFLNFLLEFFKLQYPELTVVKHVAAGIPGLEGIVWLASFAIKKGMHNKERIDQTQLNWMMLLASYTSKVQISLYILLF